MAPWTTGCARSRRASRNISANRSPSAISWRRSRRSRRLYGSQSPPPRRLQDLYLNSPRDILQTGGGRRPVFLARECVVQCWGRPEMPASWDDTLVKGSDEPMVPEPPNRPMGPWIALALLIVAAAVAVF